MRKHDRHVESVDTGDDRLQTLLKMSGIITINITTSPQD